MAVGRRWSSNPSGKCSNERPTRGTVCGTTRSMCGTDAVFFGNERPISLRNICEATTLKVNFRERETERVRERESESESESEDGGERVG